MVSEAIIATTYWFFWKRPAFKAMRILSDTPGSEQMCSGVGGKTMDLFKKKSYDEELVN